MVNAGLEAFLKSPMEIKKVDVTKGNTLESVRNNILLEVRKLAN